MTMLKAFFMCSVTLLFFLGEVSEIHCPFFKKIGLSYYYLFYKLDICPLLNT